MADSNPVPFGHDPVNSVHQLPKSPALQDLSMKFPFHQDPFEIFHSREHVTSLEWSGDALKVKKYQESCGYGIRAICEKRVGFAYTEDSKKLKDAISKAEENAKSSPQSSFSFQKPGMHVSTKTFDNIVANLDERPLKDLLVQIKDSAHKHAERTRVMIDAAQQHISIQNSEGMDASYDKTMLSAYVEAMKDDGFGFAYCSGIAIPKNISELGTRAGEMAKAMKGAKKLQTGKYTVVFSQEALHDLLTLLMKSFNGDWIRRRISRLHDLAGKKFFDEKLSIYENGKADATGIRPFDDEGVPSKELPLIEQGTVRSFMYDRETAALANVSECGCCTRPGYDSLPMISGSNTMVKCGDYGNFEDEISDFVLVHSLHGIHTANTTTGDFGGEVNIAFHIQNGNKTGKRGFLLSGNIFSMLSDIHGIEKSAATYDNFIAPRMAFKDVQIVG